jgi:hypothetical protein
MRSVLNSSNAQLRYMRQVLTGHPCAPDVCCEPVPAIVRAEVVFHAIRVGIMQANLLSRFGYCQVDAIPVQAPTLVVNEQGLCVSCFSGLDPSVKYWRLNECVIIISVKYSIVYRPMLILLTRPSDDLYQSFFFSLAIKHLRRQC